MELGNLYGLLLYLPLNLNAKHKLQSKKKKFPNFPLPELKQQKERTRNFHPPLTKKRHIKESMVILDSFFVGRKTFSQAIIENSSFHSRKKSSPRKIVLLFSPLPYLESQRNLDFKGGPQRLE